MITFKQLIESFKNQKLFSKRSESERKAIHSQLRQLNRTDDAADNSNARPLTDKDYAELEKWAKSREKDPGFKGVVDNAKYQIAVHKQSKTRNK